MAAYATQDTPDTLQDEAELIGDMALLSFLKREQKAFLACQRTSLVVRLVILAMFFVPSAMMNPVNASWLYAWVAFYVCLEVVAVLAERAATKKVQQQLVSLTKYGSKHRLVRAPEITELPLADITRKLLFGAVLGADAGVLLTAAYPSLFPEAGFGQIVYAGSAVGAVVSQLLESWIAALLSPMSRRAKRYLAIVELSWARSKGTVGESQANSIRERLQAEYFRDESSSSRRAASSGSV